jgi:hypothetical protein
MPTYLGSSHMQGLRCRRRTHSADWSGPSAAPCTAQVAATHRASARHSTASSRPARNKKRISRHRHCCLRSQEKFVQWLRASCLACQMPAQYRVKTGTKRPCPTYLVYTMTPLHWQGECVGQCHPTPAPRSCSFTRSGGMPVVRAAMGASPSQAVLSA